MRPVQALRLGVVLLATCAAPAARAQVDDVRGSWVVGVGADFDAESNNGLLAQVNVGVGRRTWLSFAAARTTADRLDLSADTRSAAVDHRFGRLIGVTFGVERWGDPAALESTEWRGSLYIVKPRLRLALEVERRRLDIPFTLTGPFGGTLSRSAALDADGTQLTLAIEPAERWRVHASLAEHDYERGLALIPRIERLNVLSASTLTLANSLVDRERRVGFEREIGAGLFSADLARDESAIDATEFETVSAAWLFPLGRRVDLELELGRGRSDLLEPAVYGGLLFVVYGH
jgi:hypothetical protein